MIKGVYVLVSSILFAAVLTLVITIFRDRIFNILIAILNVPASSAYNIVDDVGLLTSGLYIAPIIVVIVGFVYFALTSVYTETDTAALLYGRPPQ